MSPSAPRPSTLLFAALLLSALLGCARAGGCHIAKPWSSSVPDRRWRHRERHAAAPYCLLLSSAEAYNDTLPSFHYALDVRDGSVAWRWPASQLNANQYALWLQPSARPERLYAIAW